MSQCLVWKTAGGDNTPTPYSEGIASQLLDPIEWDIPEPTSIRITDEGGIVIEWKEGLISLTLTINGTSNHAPPSLRRDIALSFCVMQDIDSPTLGKWLHWYIDAKEGNDEAEIERFGFMDTPTARTGL